MESLTDHYLLYYLQEQLKDNINKYRFMEPIRPSEFLLNSMNIKQKKIYKALHELDKCECPICYDELNEYNTIKTDCQHCFCKDCFSKSISYNSSCPYCRNNVVTYEELFVNPIYLTLYFKFVPYIEFIYVKFLKRIEFFRGIKFNDYFHNFIFWN